MLVLKAADSPPGSLAVMQTHGLCGIHQTLLGHAQGLAAGGPQACCSLSYEP